MGFLRLGALVYDLRDVAAPPTSFFSEVFGNIVSF
jgi:hypothetical protein